MEKDEKKKVLKNTLAELAIVQSDLLLVMRNSLVLIDRCSEEYKELQEMYNEADDLMDCFGKRLSEYMRNLDSEKD